MTTTPRYIHTIATSVNMLVHPFYLHTDHFTFFADKTNSLQESALSMPGILMN